MQGGCYKLLQLDKPNKTLQRRYKMHQDNCSKYKKIRQVFTGVNAPQPN